MLVNEFGHKFKWGLMPNSQMIIMYLHKIKKNRNPTKKNKKLQKFSGTRGCEEKCESCIIYLESCNLSIRVSVRMALCTVIDHAVKPQTRDFTAQMPPELHVQMKR